MILESCGGSKVINIINMFCDIKHAGVSLIRTITFVCSEVLTYYIALTLPDEKVESKVRAI